MDPATLIAAGWKYVLTNPFSMTSFIIVVVIGTYTLLIKPYLDMRAELKTIRENQCELKKLMVGDGKTSKIESIDDTVTKIKNKTFGKDDDNPEEYCLARNIDKSLKGVKSLAKLYHSQKTAIDQLNSRDDEIKKMLYEFLIETSKRDK